MPTAKPITASDLGAATASLLLRAGAVQVSHDRPFVLASGWASPVYVDCRRLIGVPALRKEATELLIASLRRTFGTDPPFDAIAGSETAGIPWASLLADRLGLPLRYVRKRPLGIGRHAQVEGGSVEGLRVLLVDDLATDMASKVAFTRGLRTAGAAVTNTVVLFYNRAFPGGAERLLRIGLTLNALATWDDILRLDASEHSLAPADRSLIEQFLSDPVTWSANHGGRHAASERGPDDRNPPTIEVRPRRSPDR